MKITGIGLIFCSLVACEKYLAEKPSSSLAVPSSVRDYQALIDYQSRMNDYYPDCGDNAADFFYLRDEDWMARREYARDVYVWAPQTDASQDWSVCYEKIFYTNVILEGINGATLDGLSEADRDRVKGGALFLRGWTYLHLIPLFTPTYDVKASDSPYGLPLRLTPDINVETQRASLNDTYGQVESDLLKAIPLLPDQAVIATRPSKAAAYAALARMYLMMERYRDALAYADSCLAVQSVLMDYNDLSVSGGNSFQELNPEVIFHARLQGQSGVLTQSRARVDTVLYSMYDDDDLRKTLFFETHSDGSLLFRGSYHGSSSIFSGLASDEVYLTKAECLIRLGDFSKGMEVMRMLLEKRWRTGTFLGFSDVADRETALEFVLEERRKELAFRGGIRWADLKRLNKDERFATTLIRKIDGTTYVLEPNDPRYTFLIPAGVTNIVDILQNER